MDLGLFKLDKQTLIYIILGVVLCLTVAILLFIGIKIYIKKRRTSVASITNTATGVTTTTNPIYRDPNRGSTANLILNATDSDSNTTVVSEIEIQGAISMDTLISNISETNLDTVSIISESSI